MSKKEEDTLRTPISNARTPKEIGAFWDTHSLADYWDQTREAEFEVSPHHPGPLPEEEEGDK
jgi:hypothetical protein